MYCISQKILSEQWSGFYVGQKNSTLSVWILLRKACPFFIKLKPSPPPWSVPRKEIRNYCSCTTQVAISAQGQPVPTSSWCVDSKISTTLSSGSFMAYPSECLPSLSGSRSLLVPLPLSSLHSQPYLFCVLYSTSSVQVGCPTRTHPRSLSHIPPFWTPSPMSTFPPIWTRGSSEQSM